MVRYHFGIFSFTGGEKRNFLSNVLRKILLHTQDTKVVIFDISSEYPFLLMDIFADPKIKARIVLESPVKNSEQFYISVVKPREYEDDERVKSGLAKIFDKQIVSHFVKPESLVPRCSDILAELVALKGESVGKPHYINAVDDIYQKLPDCMIENGLTETHFIDENFVHILCEVAPDAMKTYRVNDKASLYAWATTRDTLRGRLKKKKNQSKGDDDEITNDKLREIIEGDTRLTCISISDPYTIKNLVVDLTSDFLYKRKKQLQKEGK